MLSTPAHRALPSATAAALYPGPAAGVARSLYLQALAWAFAVFSSIRMVAYLPTMWSIHLSGDSSQHSLLTWLTWTGANMTMAAWLYEHNGQHVDRAILVNLGNALMCGASSMLIVWYRL
ncbi:MAG TPA: hypothetical protein PKA20_12445 [Burkholderiaceae bacterium]|nr:hypothetical protein [Burkholderiaceae bacterium]